MISESKKLGEDRLTGAELAAIDAFIHNGADSPILWAGNTRLYGVSGDGVVVSASYDEPEDIDLLRKILGDAREF